MIPFRTGVQVTGQDFCPRKEELGLLCESMESSGRVYIVGERRIGKSSLIAEAARQLKQKKSVFVDLMAVKDLEDISHRLGQALIRSEKRQSRILALVKSLSMLRPVISAESTTGSLSITFTAGTGNRLETLDELFDAIGSQKNIVVVFDEFQDLLEISDAPRIIAKVRGLVQQQKNTAFIFCGSIRNRMEKIFTDEQSPFFNAAVRLPVGPLDKALFKEFLLKRFLRGHRTVPDPLMESIMEACHNNPGHIQRFCISLWQATSAGNTLTEKDVSAAWSVLFSMQKDSYELMLTTLSPQQTKVLRALAHAGGSSVLSAAFIATTGITLAPSVRKAMMALMDRRLVQKISTTYQFCDPFFAVWLRTLPM